ncbi:hypothetical protein ACEQ8H_002471 [Pleosporales sp. CAS-2024a]
MVHLSKKQVYAQVLEQARLLFDGQRNWTILFARGVCGTAAASQTTQLVADVEKFPGHIACDGASRSEIVVPIVKEGKTVAIIDVDCAELNGFDDEDQRALEELAGILAEACDFGN